MPAPNGVPGPKLRMLPDGTPDPRSLDKVLSNFRQELLACLEGRTPKAGDELKLTLTLRFD